jgi:hypothetical protein
MTKIWIWGVLVLLIAGCSNLAENTPAGISQKSMVRPSGGEGAAVSLSPPAGENPTSSPTADEFRAELEDYGPAPELTNDTWLNVSQPLRLANLRGKVVLIDMWTYG